MVKVRKNSKFKIWNVYACNGDFLGEFSFFREQVKAYFPGCLIHKQNVFLK